MGQKSLLNMSLLFRCERFERALVARLEHRLAVGGCGGSGGCHRRGCIALGRRSLQVESEIETEHLNISFEYMTFPCLCLS